jgi:NADPH:quinone reductase-like Zn-dependent oxidoreductase
MFAVYASGPSLDDPLASLVVGERPESEVPEGWVRVKVSHASLNRHDLFTLRGITAQRDPIPFPMILGNDGAGTLDDGTSVVIYPVMGSDDWREDETLDPRWHIFSERVPGTFADYVVVPRRNAIPLPDELSALDASVLGTAWLTAYRALFTKSALKPGETVLVQGASGGMSTALVQLGCAAGLEVWATSRSATGRKLAEKLGAHRTFDANETLPRKVQAVIDNIGPASWEHSMASVARGGTLVVTGALEDMRNMISFIVGTGIKPEIGQVLPMERATEAFRAMWKGETYAKTVFTR